MWHGETKDAAHRNVNQTLNSTGTHSDPEPYRAHRNAYAACTTWLPPGSVPASQNPTGLALSIVEKRTAAAWAACTTWLPPGSAASVLKPYRNKIV